MIIIFDSGIGGFECAQKLTNNSAENEILYYADTQNFPYGNKTNAQLREIITNAFKFFETKQPTQIIVACNTASSIIQEMCQEQINGFENGTHHGAYNGIRIVDTLSTLNKIMDEESDLTVLCTKLTHDYLSTRSTLSSGHKIIALPELAWLVEFQELDKIADYIRSLVPADTKKILYACTHYPLVHNIFAQTFNATFINPMDKMLASLAGETYRLTFNDKNTSEKYKKIMQNHAN